MRLEIDLRKTEERVKSGSLVVVNSRAYMVADIGIKGRFLICLATGNRWNSTPIPNLTRKGITDYVNTGTSVNVVDAFLPRLDVEVLQ